MSKLQKPIETTSDESALVRWIPILAVGWIVLYLINFFCTEISNNGIYRLDLVELIPEFIWLNFFPESSPEMPAGYVYLIQRIPIALPAMFILFTCWCAGRLSFRGLHLLGKVDVPTEFCICTAIGLSLCSLLTLLSGTVGLLDQILFCAIFCIVITVELAIIWRARTSFYRMKSGSSKKIARSTKSGSKLLRNLCLGTCLLFVGCMALGAMLPSTDFDVKEYHLQGPKEFFQDGHVHFLPHNVYTSFPFLTEMLSLCGMVIMNDWWSGALVGKTVLMCFAPLTAVGVFCLAKRICNSTTGYLAALFYLSTPWVTRFSIIAYTEGALCCYALLTLLSLVVLHEQPKSRSFRWIFVIGLLAGSAVATKYPGLLLVTFPAGTAVLALQLSEVRKNQDIFTKHTRRMLLLKSLGIFTGGVLITFGPWMLKNFGETGNPVYPLLYSVFGGVDWNAELQQKWKDAHPPLGIKNGFVRLFTDFKANLIDVTIKSDWQSPLLLAFAPLALFLKRKRVLIWSTLGHVLWMAAVWYLLTHRIDRFWLPILPGLSVLAATGCHHLWNITANNEQSSAATRYAGLIVPMTVVGCLLFNYALVSSPIIGFNAYLMDLPTAHSLAKKPSIQLLYDLNLREPHILFVGEAEVFDTTFSHNYNTVFDISLLEELCSIREGAKQGELLPPEQIRENLQRAGYTHLFVNWSEILRYRTTYRYTDFVTPARFQSLVEANLLRRVPLQPEKIYRLWDPVDGRGGVNQSWQDEIMRWGPTLKQNFAGQDVMLQYELFEVVAD